MAAEDGECVSGVFVRRGPGRGLGEGAVVGGGEGAPLPTRRPGEADQVGEDAADQVTSWVAPEQVGAEPGEPASEVEFVLRGPPGGVHPCGGGRQAGVDELGDSGV